METIQVIQGKIHFLLDTFATVIILYLKIKLKLHVLKVIEFNFSCSKSPPLSGYLNSSDFAPTTSPSLPQPPPLTPFGSLQNGVSSRNGPLDEAQVAANYFHSLSAAVPFAYPPPHGNGFHQAIKREENREHMNIQENRYKALKGVEK